MEEKKITLGTQHTYNPCNEPTINIAAKQTCGADKNKQVAGLHLLSSIEKKNAWMSFHPPTTICHGCVLDKKVLHGYDHSVA